MPKAAFASAQDRPKAQRHYETMAVRRVVSEIRDVIIVDDVVTRGATLLGATSRLAEALPGVRVRGFAAIRTISNPDEFSTIGAPIIGRIEYRDGETIRRP